MKIWLGVTLGMGLVGVGAGVSAQAEEMNRLYNYNSGDIFTLIQQLRKNI